MNFSNEIKDYFLKLKMALDSIKKDEIKRFGEILLRHYDCGTNIFIFGNGGSGATASHAVCDFNKGTCLNMEKKFRFICLNDNIPSIMAYANDIGFEDVFYQQLKVHLRPQDLVIAISGSGNSKNVIKAVEYAKQSGAETFTLCGHDGGRLRKIDSLNNIFIKIKDMQIVEDCHIIILHMLSQILRQSHR